MHQSTFKQKQGGTGLLHRSADGIADVDAQAAENRIRNQYVVSEWEQESSLIPSRNMNVYGQQADDAGTKSNDYNEAN